ncbi:geranylgeranyl pyrophosphate synthase [Corynebacterium atypicum]|uniref:Geranylgeranyl pyrophosphate synthase n=1 Tax=Corynebacterium atypicum TaxID=191610 RepID=A0ABM5QNL1_9CORY|nr:geranylgeranyl pyrophosphate synthase [Corynebacterium atypicum]
MTDSFEPHSAQPADFPSAVTQVLRKYFDRRQPEIERIGGAVARSVDHLRDFVLGGGKRVRPLYGWVGYLAGGGDDCGEDPLAVLRAVSSLEFIQACALIHDDIIDSSDTRRGAPTVHRLLADKHRAGTWLGDPDHFGESAAILTGDLALVWAEDMLQDSGLTAAALRRTREPWRAMRTEVIGGQLLDIALEATGSEDPGQADAVNRFKTAAYTIERPLHLGAAIAGASADTISQLRAYGRDVGIAFQLRDDLLGVFGDPEVTGKPASDDIREGKRTVLFALALQSADDHDPETAQLLRSGIGSHDPHTIAEVTAAIERTGARQAVEERIDALLDSGLAHLDRFDEHTQTVLDHLATHMAARHK